MSVRDPGGQKDHTKKRQRYKWHPVLEALKFYSKQGEGLNLSEEHVPSLLEWNPVQPTYKSGCRENQILNFPFSM